MAYFQFRKEQPDAGPVKKQKRLLFSLKMMNIYIYIQYVGIHMSMFGCKAKPCLFLNWRYRAWPKQCIYQ